MLVANKSEDAVEAKNKYKTAKDILFISAKNKTGIDDLKNAVYNGAIQTPDMADTTIVTNARHYESLQQIARSLSDIKNGLHNNIPGDLLALDIRRCLYYLGEITGEITNEDKLDFIFSKFCIGK
jgi:tRNA modification GTPase